MNLIKRTLGALGMILRLVFAVPAVIIILAAKLIQITAETMEDLSNWIIQWTRESKLLLHNKSWVMAQEAINENVHLKHSNKMLLARNEGYIDRHEALALEGERLEGIITEKDFRHSVDQVNLEEAGKIIVTLRQKIEKLQSDKKRGHRYVMELRAINKAQGDTIRHDVEISQILHNQISGLTSQNQILSGREIAYRDELVALKEAGRFLGNKLKAAENLVYLATTSGGQLGLLAKDYAVKHELGKDFGANDSDEEISALNPPPALIHDSESFEEVAAGIRK